MCAVCSCGAGLAAMYRLRFSVCAAATSVDLYRLVCFRLSPVRGWKYEGEVGAALDCSYALRRIEGIFFPLWRDGQSAWIFRLSLLLWILAGWCRAAVKRRFPGIGDCGVVSGSGSRRHCEPS